MEKKPEQYTLEYAGFWIRLGAAVVDVIIVASIILAFRSIFLTFFTEINERWVSIFIMALISWLIKIAYFIGFWIWRGQTPGKIIAGIKIIRTDGSALDWPHAVLRYLGYIVSYLTLFIGFLWIAFDEHKQGLHDKIADTHVVKLPVRQVILSGNYARGRVG